MKCQQKIRTKAVKTPCGRSSASQAEPHMPGTRNCYSVFGPIDPIGDGTRSYGSQSLCTSHGTAGQRHIAVVDQGQRQLLEAGQSGN